MRRPLAPGVGAAAGFLRPAVLRGGAGRVLTPLIPGEAFRGSPARERPDPRFGAGERGGSGASDPACGAVPLCGSARSGRSSAAGKRGGEGLFPEFRGVFRGSSGSFVRSRVAALFPLLSFTWLCSGQVLAELSFDLSAFQAGGSASSGGEYSVEKSVPDQPLSPRCFSVL